MPAPKHNPQLHTLAASLLAAFPVNTVPLYVEAPVLDDPLLALDVAKPPTEAITPPKEPVVVVLPRNALNASVVDPPITTDDPSL